MKRLNSIVIPLFFLFYFGGTLFAQTVQPSLRTYEHAPLNEAIAEAATTGFRLTHLVWDDFNTSSFSWAFDDSLKYFYASNTANRQSETVYFSHDGFIWNKTRHSLFTRDANQNTLEELSEVWNGSSYEPGNRYTYTYNASGKTESYISQIFVDSIGNWVNQNRTLYTYTASGLNESFTHQTWNNGTQQWKNNIRYINYYDANDKGIQWLYQLWNNSTAVWESNERELYVRDGLSRRVKTNGYSWDGSNWIPAWGERLYYDGSSTRTTDYVFFYINSGIEIPYDSTRSSYTASGLTEQGTNYRWNNSLSIYEPYMNDLYEYDANDNNTKHTTESWDGSLWQNDYRVRYAYESYQPSGLAAQNHSVNVKLYPNPAGDILSFESKPKAAIEEAVVNIYTAAGILKKSFPVEANQTSHQLRMSDLPAGTYLMTMIQGGDIAFSRLFIKQ